MHYQVNPRKGNRAGTHLIVTITFQNLRPCRYALSSVLVSIKTTHGETKTSEQALDKKLTYGLSEGDTFSYMHSIYGANPEDLLLSSLHANLVDTLGNRYSLDPFTEARRLGQLEAQQRQVIPAGLSIVWQPGAPVYSYEYSLGGNHHNILFRVKIYNLLEEGKVCLTRTGLLMEDAKKTNFGTDI